MLPQILPLFPDDINTFVDLFCGGANVGVNIKANKIICNDYMKQLIDLYNEFKINKIDDIYNYIFETINKFNLSKTNQEGYLKLRDQYNIYKNPLDLYICICYSFSNQIRFNSKGEFNMPFGKNRSSFNDALQNRLKLFINKLNNIEFWSTDFKHLGMNLNMLTNNDLVYCDPPYLNTTATYNEQNGWNEAKELELYELLDNIHNIGSRFALSNIFENKGKSNDLLKEWSKKYNIHYLNNTYGNCNYHAKDKSKDSTIEVLITNY